MLSHMTFTLESAVSPSDSQNAHRILEAKGKVAEGFAFRDGRTDDPVELLKSEGIRFVNGRADPRQRWQPESI
jgi:hypothetical protein